MDTSPSSINQIARLAFSQPLQWLSPAPGERESIGWISISLEETSPGDLLLAPSGAASSDYLKIAQEKNACAVLFLGKKPPKKVAIPVGLPVAVLAGK